MKKTDLCAYCGKKALSKDLRCKTCGHTREEAQRAARQWAHKDHDYYQKLKIDCPHCLAMSRMNKVAMI